MGGGGKKYREVWRDMDSGTWDDCGGVACLINFIGLDWFVLIGVFCLRIENPLEFFCSIDVIVFARGNNIKSVTLDTCFSKIW